MSVLVEVNPKSLVASVGSQRLSLHYVLTSTQFIVKNTTFISSTQSRHKSLRDSSCGAAGLVQPKIVKHRLKSPASETSLFSIPRRCTHAVLSHCTTLQHPSCCLMPRRSDFLIPRPSHTILYHLMPSHACSSATSSSCDASGYLYSGDDGASSAGGGRKRMTSSMSCGAKIRRPS